MTPLPYPLVSSYSRAIARPWQPPGTSFRPAQRPPQRRTETREAFVPLLTHHPIRTGVVRVSRGGSVWAKWARVLGHGDAPP